MAAPPPKESGWSHLQSSIQLMSDVFDRFPTVHAVGCRTRSERLIVAAQKHNDVIRRPHGVVVAGTTSAIAIDELVYGFSTNEAIENYTTIEAGGAPPAAIVYIHSQNLSVGVVQIDTHVANPLAIAMATISQPDKEIQDLMLAEMADDLVAVPNDNIPRVFSLNTIDMPDECRSDAHKLRALVTATICTTLLNHNSMSYAVMVTGPFPGRIFPNPSISDRMVCQLQAHVAPCAIDLVYTDMLIGCTINATAISHPSLTRLASITSMSGFFGLPQTVLMRYDVSALRDEHNQYSVMSGTGITEYLVGRMWDRWFDRITTQGGAIIKNNIARFDEVMEHTTLVCPAIGRPGVDWVPDLCDICTKSHWSRRLHGVRLAIGKMIMALFTLLGPLKPIVVKDDLVDINREAKLRFNRLTEEIDVARAAIENKPDPITAIIERCIFPVTVYLVRERFADIVTRSIDAEPRTKLMLARCSRVFAPRLDTYAGCSGTFASELTAQLRSDPAITLPKALFAIRSMKDQHAELMMDALKQLCDEYGCSDPGVVFAPDSTQKSIGEAIAVFVRGLRDVKTHSDVIPRFPLQHQSLCANFLTKKPVAATSFEIPVSPILWPCATPISKTHTVLSTTSHLVVLHPMIVTNTGVGAGCIVEEHGMSPSAFELLSTSVRQWRNRNADQQNPPLLWLFDESDVAYSESVCKFLQSLGGVDALGEEKHDVVCVAIDAVGRSPAALERVRALGVLPNVICVELHIPKSIDVLRRIHIAIDMMRQFSATLTFPYIALCTPTVGNAQRLEFGVGTPRPCSPLAIAADLQHIHKTYIEYIASIVRTLSYVFVKNVPLYPVAQPETKEFLVDKTMQIAMTWLGNPIFIRHVSHVGETQINALHHILWDIFCGIAQRLRGAPNTTYTALGMSLLVYIKNMIEHHLNSTVVYAPTGTDRILERTVEHPAHISFPTAIEPATCGMVVLDVCNTDPWKYSRSIILSSAYPTTPCTIMGAISLVSTLTSEEEATLRALYTAIDIDVTPAVVPSEQTITKTPVLPAPQAK